MPRGHKGIHGRPENAGLKNLPEGYAEKNKDEDGMLAGTLPIYKKGFENRENYKGVWDEESLKKEIFAYFEYCEEYNVKVAKVGISLWLGISKETMYEWVRNPAKYGFKSDLMKMAHDAIEISYIGRAEKYPTANLFLLRTSHGHIEQSKIDISTNNTGVGQDEVNDLVSKLGLDKK